MKVKSRFKIHVKRHVCICAIVTEKTRNESWRKPPNSVMVLNFKTTRTCPSERAQIVDPSQRHDNIAVTNFYVNQAPSDRVASRKTDSSKRRFRASSNNPKNLRYSTNVLRCSKNVKERTYS